VGDWLAMAAVMLLSWIPLIGLVVWAVFSFRSTTSPGSQRHRFHR
jgi:hypothetical protein